MKNSEIRFSHVKGKVVLLINERNYKGHLIQKVIYRGIEYFSVDKERKFFLLKDAKKFVDTL